MGELLLVSGGNGSGKSRFAERWLDERAGKERWYIATMLPQTEDNYARIEKHRRQREGLGFTTLELPRKVGNAPVGGAVLLEDVSNLLANVYFENGGTAETVFRDILNLHARCELLAAVTISGLTEEGYSGETAAYIRELNRLNRLLLDAADQAVELRNGTEVWMKNFEGKTNRHGPL